MKDKILLENVTHGFESNQQSIVLFKGLTLEVTRGQSVSVIGPSGVGKSSLLMLMAGLEQPRVGSFSYVSKGLKKSVSELRKHSGFVFQQFHLLPELDALHNLALPLRLNGDKQADEKAREWLAKVGLEGREKHKPGQLSGGEQQRVAIARAFISQPQFVFADEPTGNLDKKTAENIKTLMFQCATEQGAGLMYVTHDEGFAGMAGRCLQLDSEGMTERVTQTKLEVVG